MSGIRARGRQYGGKSAEQRRAERRATLVEAGREIWEAEGWGAVTMRRVCAASGLIDRYFYESFPDRDALLAEIWDQSRQRLLARFLEAIRPLSDAPPLEQLGAAIVALVHHIADAPGEAEITFGDHAGSAVLAQRRRDSVQQGTDLLVGLAGRYLRKDADEAAFRINVLVGIGGFVELMLAWRSGLLDCHADSLIEHLIGLSAALAPRFLRGGA